MNTTIERLRLLVAGYDRKILTADEVFFRVADDVLTDLLDEAEKDEGGKFEMALAGSFSEAPPSRAARIEVGVNHIAVQRCK